MSLADHSSSPKTSTMPVLKTGVFFEQKNRLLSALKDSLSELEYTIWLADLSFRLVEENTQQNLLVLTTSEFKKEKIVERYFTLLKNLCMQYFGIVKLDIAVVAKQETIPLPQVENTDFEVEQVSPQSPAKTDSDSKTTLTQGRRVLGENTLNHFIELPENHLALSFIKKALERPGAINPIYIYGPVGVGKTHLLHAFANAFQKDAPFAQVEYLTPDDFVSDFTLALSTKTDRNFRIRYRSVDALLIDDIQFFMGKEKSSVEFFHVFNAIHASGKQMIFTSDRDPRELGDLDDRLKSRISSSAIIEIKAPALESRTRLLDAYLQRENLELHEEVRTYLAERLTGDIRQLVGAIRYLAALASMQGSGAQGNIIDITFCEEHLKQLPKKRISWSESTKVHPEKILAAVSSVSSITIKDLKTKKKSKHLSNYRQIAMYLLRNYTDLSLPEIGFSLGGRSTTTVSYGVDKITATIAKEKSAHQNKLQDQIAEILTEAAKLAVF